MEITGALLRCCSVFFRDHRRQRFELPAGLLPGTKPGYRAVNRKKKPVPTRKAAAAAWGHRNRPASYDPVVPRFLSWDANSLASPDKNTT